MRKSFDDINRGSVNDFFEEYEEQQEYGAKEFKRAKHAIHDELGLEQQEYYTHFIYGGK